jgi:ubiquinone/menaquinone biosynthesis C-methylase UbiE
MNEPKKFNPHEVHWTSEKISRIWDFTSTQDSEYFSRRAGDSVIKLVKRKIPLYGKVLDFGCGPGHFIELLLERKIYSGGFDLSPESIKAVEAKFSSNPYFLKGIHSSTFPIPIENNFYDVIFLIETIEHLLPEQIDSTLKEIRRILKKDGYIAVTTRNEEDLNKNKAICPDCGCVFHRKQHISSFSADSLSSFITNSGFSTIFCKPVLFSITRLSWIRRLYIQYLRISGEKMPSLLYIGKKI